MWYDTWGTNRVKRIDVDNHCATTMLTFENSNQVCPHQGSAQMWCLWNRTRCPHTFPSQVQVLHLGEIQVNSYFNKPLNTLEQQLNGKQKKKHAYAAAYLQGKWTPGWRQAIIWTNAGILLIAPLEINFNEILIEINTFSFKKMYLKMSSAKWRLFRLGLNVLMNYVIMLSPLGCSIWSWAITYITYISIQMISILR